MSLRNVRCRFSEGLSFRAQITTAIRSSGKVDTSVMVPRLRNQAMVIIFPEGSGYMSTMTTRHFERLVLCLTIQ